MTTSARWGAVREVAPLHASMHASMHASARVLADLSAEAVLLVDGDGGTMAVEGNLMRVLGVDEHGALGRPLDAWVDAGSRDALRTVLARLRGGELSRGRIDVTILLPDGGTRLVECTAAMLSANDDAHGFVLNLRDIHEQRRAEAALRSALEQLERRLHELGAERAFDAALSRVAELLQHCASAAETHDVLWASLPSLIPGFEATLFVESDDALEFVQHRAPSSSTTYLPAESCWALRTHRAHISDGLIELRCDHLTPDDVEEACLPLVVSGHVVALIVLRVRNGGPPMPPRDQLDRVALRLGIVVGNARYARALTP